MFTGQGLRITGHLAEPLGGELPLLSALPILATLDGPIDPTARTWASATKVALEAVAARRVYPALDGEGRDCWRLPRTSRPRHRTLPSRSSSTRSPTRCCVPPGRPW